MSTMIKGAAWVAAAFLAACGGGGGGGGTISGGGVSGGGTGGVQLVAISDTNAKPVGATALQSAQSSAATQGSNLVTGVQADAASPAAFTGGMQVATAVRDVLAQVTASPSVATGIVINQTSACALGGTVTVSGTVAGSSALVAGDSVTISASNCKSATNGVTRTMNGSIAITVASGSIGSSLPFHVVLATTATNLSLQTGTTTVVSSGDARIDITAAGVGQETVVASGTAIASRTTTSAGTRSTTLNNYTQTVAISGSTATSSMSATVTTDSTALGTSGGSVTVTTVTPVTYDVGTNVATSGAVRAVGANGSQLLATVTGGGNVTLQVDSNGDGTFERTITTTTSELASLD